MMKIKNLIKLFVPEILLILKRKLIKFDVREKDLINKKKKLFDGYSSLFKKSLSQSSIYGEYGCGQSTIYVSKKFNIPIFSVDSSKPWQKKIKKISYNKKLHLKYINIGNVGPKSMGWPDDFSLKENFNDYAMEIWKYKLKPNVVLIDGRLRVLCFLITLRECKIGTKIIFDDYVSRKHYHIVEELIKPISNDGRQCLFEVNSKKKINKKKLNFLINKFNYVLH